MAAADAERQPHPHKHTRLIGVLLLVGGLGLMTSVLPWDRLMSSCPYLVRNALTNPLGALASLAGIPQANVGSSASDGRYPPPRGTDTETGLPLWEEADLRPYTGEQGRAILLGMGGDVFDVTEKGAHFYGPGAGYSVFAGRDSTRCLALGSLEQADLDRGGDVADFDDMQKGQLKEQHEFYLGKYPRVGRLMPKSKAAR